MMSSESDFSTSNSASEFLAWTGKRDLPESLIAALFTVFDLSSKSIQLLQHCYAAFPSMNMARAFLQGPYVLEFMDADLR